MHKINPAMLVMWFFCAMVWATDEPITHGLALAFWAAAFIIMVRRMFIVRKFWNRCERKSHEFKEIVERCHQGGDLDGALATLRRWNRLIDLWKESNKKNCIPTSVSIEDI